MARFERGHTTPMRVGRGSVRQISADVGLAELEENEESAASRSAAVIGGGSNWWKRLAAEHGHKRLHSMGKSPRLPHSAHERSYSRTLG